MKKIIYKRIPFSDTLNFRDLGGYATQNGKTTNWNVFYRSACPNSLNNSDLKLLKELGITAVIDLRGGGNVDEKQTGYTSIKDFKHYNLALGGGIPPRRATDCPYSYMEIADSPNIKKVFEILSENDGAVLFHCFAGKDRTGIVAALLQLLAGVDDVDIIADYTLSYAYFLARIRMDFSRFDAEMDVFRPLPDHMEGFLRVFREKYGTAQNYLLKIGLSQAQIDRLIKKLVG